MWLKYSIIICYVHIFVIWLLNVICRLCLDVNAIIDNVVTSDLIHHNWRERFVPLCRMHWPCRVIRPDYVMCAQFLFIDVIILVPRQTRVYMLLSEGLLVSGICGQTWPKSTPHYLTAWLHYFFGRRQFDLRRSGYYGTQPRRVISSKDQRDPVLGHI